MMNNIELRNLMDRDVNNLHFNKNKRHTERDNTYKYGNDNNQKVVEGQIPQWAKDALADPKPGEVVGSYSQDALRNKNNQKAWKMVEFEILEDLAAALFKHNCFETDCVKCKFCNHHPICDLLLKNSTQYLFK